MPRWIHTGRGFEVSECPVCYTLFLVANGLPQAVPSRDSLRLLWCLPNLSTLQLVFSYRGQRAGDARTD